MKTQLLNVTKNLNVLLATIVFLGAQLASAATTVLTFDDIASGMDVTTQYQSYGISTTGASVIDSSLAPWPAQSAPNIAYSPMGLMRFDFDSAILGDVQSVSAYISGDYSVGIYAYDAAGAFLGQALTGGPSNNMLVSVSSSGNPIARVEIHNGGSTFAIDTLSITSADTAPTCENLVDSLYNDILAIPSSAFKSAAKAVSQRNTLLNDVIQLRAMMDANVSKKKILAQISKISLEVNTWLKACTCRDALNILLNEIANMVKNDQC